VKNIEDMQFSCEPDSGGKFVGRVAEFPKLRSKPHTNRLDALDEIIRLAADRLREIDCSQQDAANAAKGTP